MSNCAAVMPELGTIEIKDVGYPSIGPREVIVQVEAVGVCGSDTAYYRVGYIGDWVVDGPLILGHEVAGRVQDIGSAVTQVKVGDRVAIEPGQPCRDCRDCLAGRYHLCPRLKFLATPPYDGALTEYLAMDERNLYVLPDSMTFEEGALLEPLSVGIWACHRASLEPGDDVLITGAGPVGILAAQTARALGAASVTVIDVSEFRLEVARGLGFVTERSDAPSDTEFDVFLECSGAPGVLGAGLWRLRTNGRAAMVGMPKKDVELPLSRLNLKELTISLVNRYSHTWPTAIALVASGRVDVQSLVTHRFTLDETEEAITLASRVPDSMKAMIFPQQRRS
jgi:L-iditol 2-dehydrogenase